MSERMRAAVRILTGATLRHAGVVPAAVLLLAALMVLSPVTLVSGLVLLGLTIAACRGLEGAERRAVLVMMVVAIAIRVALVLMLFAASDPNHVISFPFDGDGLAVENRSLWARNVWLGVPVDPYHQYLAFTTYGWTSYIYVLAYVQYLLGPAPYAVHLVSICCYMAGTVMMHRLMRRWYGSTAALFACGLILFLPSLVLWSVAAMRESLQFLSLALCVVALVRLACERGLPARLTGAAMLAGSIWLIYTVREHALSLIAAVTVTALAATFVTRRAYVLLLALLVIPPATVYVLDHPVPSLQATVFEQLRPMARRHRSSVNDEGHSYKVLDERFYWQEPVVEVVQTMTWSEAQRYVLRGLIAVVLVPFPWQAWSRTEVLFVPIQMIWYVLLCLALVGTVRGLRTAVLPTWTFIALTAITCVGMAPIEGNIGTMVRHRDMILPFVACLSALGIVSMLSWAGVWTGVADTAAADDAPPTFVERVVGGSRVLGAIRGSLTYTLAGRASIGYHADRYSRPHRRPIEDLSAWVTSSVVGRLSMASSRALAAACSGSAILAWTTGTIADIRALQPWQRFRLAGVVSLAALLLAAPLARGAEQGWPAAVVWAVTVACALAVVLAARPLGAAWRRKSQSSMRLGASPSIEATV